MKITAESLRSLCDYQSCAETVRGVLETAIADRPLLLKFMARYASWNGLFGSGVASLAAKIGRSQDLFVEKGFPPPLSDRSVLVASYFFDAARDEFDDRDTEHRDTHRCLAQATLAGLVEASKDAHPELAEGPALTTLMRPPLWLRALRDRVAVGYGHGSADERPGIFRAIGYHLGSEVLADQEFSMIDAALRKHAPGLVDELSGKSVTIAGQPHRCYQWIGIHSGEGGAAEAEHFEWAVRGADLAFMYTPQSLHAELRHQLDTGYLEFADDHEEFFERVLG